jgi:hypothetical protein
LWVEIEDVFPSLKEWFKDKNAVAVKQACDFLQALMKNSFKEDLAKIHDTICPELVKLSNHNDGDIRDLGLSTLGLLKACIGAVIDKYLKDLNQQKLGKVTEAEAEVIKSGIKFKQKAKPKKPAAKPKPEVNKLEDDGDAIMTDSSKPPKKKAKGGPPASFLDRQQKCK